jgi:hypothetical protein
MKKSRNNICTCGHLEKDHGVFKSDSYSYEFPKTCLVGIGSDIKFVDDCREFKLDNLRYLEDCYEEKATEV